MFGLPKKTDEVLYHRIAFADSFQLSPQEFYQTVKQALEERKVPGLEMSHVEYAEGGLLSDRRLYLRMMRERLAFDVCASPFGNSLFFSCRAVYSPPVVGFLDVMVVLLLFAFIYYPLMTHLGLVQATVVLGTFILALGAVFRNTMTLGLSDLDSFLLKIPCLGPIYERWFRKETYYRTDTRLMYLAMIPVIVFELADEATAAKGIKLVRQFERAPVLGELYKLVRTTVQVNKTQ